MADSLSIVDSLMILEDGRVLFGWGVDRTTLGAQEIDVAVAGHRDEAAR